MKRAILVSAVAGLAAAAGAWGQPVRCEAKRDVWLSAVGEEADYNMGAARSMKLKVWQEFALVEFDTAGLAGRQVTDAWLYVKPAADSRHKFGLNGGTDLKWLTVSTVGHEWVEGKSTGYAKDPQGHGATFNESSYQRADWGWPGAKVYDVILGSGNTLRSDGVLVPEKGWLKIRLDPRLVQACVAGASHGLMLMDGSTSVGVNCTIASRESGSGPYLEVTTAASDRLALPAAPAAPAGLKVAPAPNYATAEKGAVQVTLTVPAGAFAYHVRVNGQPVGRWQVPFAAAAGSPQTFHVLDLPAGEAVNVEVVAVDAAGRASVPASAAGKASEKLTVPDLPASPFAPKAGEPKRLGGAVVWAFPEVTKVHPVTGQAVAEAGAEDIRRANAVWDGASGTVRLAAAKGEIVSFQVAVEGPAAGCGVKVAPPKAAGGDFTLPDKGVRIWRNWYTNGQSEYAVPLTGTFDCPSPDNAVAGQKLQAVTVDIHIPASAPPGDYAGAVTVAAGAEKVELPLKIKVYDVTIPEEVNFNPELNAYGGPGQAGSERFKASHVLAHYHRCQINRLPYGQTGGVHTDIAPAVGRDGRVTDWSTFDRNVGGLLDGSWFAANPRAGVPIAVMYLPLFEGWPLNYRKHYDPGQGVPTSGKNSDEKLRHDILARPIEEAIDQTFQDAFVNCTADFARHLSEKGYTRTIFQCYLNNKPNYGYTLWTLDEPFEYLDWAALNFFGRLFKKGVNDPDVYSADWQQRLFREGLDRLKRSRATLVYRGDISRLMWQGSCSDGIMNAVYVNSGAFNMPRLVRAARERMPAIVNVYGSCNAPDRSNWESAAWCLKAYVSHCDGVLPWQSLGGAGALKTGDGKGGGNALIIEAGKFGPAVASFRVHALRRGAQDAELLRLLQLKNGWSREHVGLLASQRVPLTAAFKQRHADEASAVTFGSLTSQGFAELKEGVLQLLSK